MCVGEAHKLSGKTYGRGQNMHLDFEVLNDYVLGAIGLFGGVLYFGLLYAGFIEFKSRISGSNSNRKRSGNRVAPRRLRKSKLSGH